jgi:hypothetical protein
MVFFDNLHLNAKIYKHIRIYKSGECSNAKYNLHNVRKKVLKQIEGRVKEGDRWQ